MAIIYTYPRLSGQPEGSDLILITDVSDDNKSKNTTIQSINDLGPQGTVTSVNLTMPSGFIVDKTRNNGDISFAVTGFPSELPADDPTNSIQYNENGTLKGSPQFLAVPISSGTIDNGVELSLGSVSRTSGPQPPQRGRIKIGSGPINQSGVDTYGASMQLEYVYPTLGPVTSGLPGSRAAAYSFVTLKAPKYDYNIEIDADGRNFSLRYQDYDLILPQINPTHSGSNQPYTNSQLLVVNGVDASSSGNLRDFETKFVPLSALGLSVGGVQNSIQFNNNNGFGGSEFFTIPLIQEPDHSPGGRLQLTIGSPVLTPNEPYGSILLNGGNNSDEGGIIRLASAINNTVGIAGPQISPSPVADYTYDFSLPTKSPEQTDQVFNRGVLEADVLNGGSDYQVASGRISTTSAGSGQGCTISIDAVDATTGAITNISVVQPGEGYSDNEVLTVNLPQHTGTAATLEVTDISGYKNKVLVASEDRAFGPTNDKLYETRWVDPNDLGISGGGTPGGVATNVQFKDSSGNFDGNSELTYNGSGRLTLGENGGNGGVLRIQAEDGAESGLLKIGHSNLANYITLGLEDGTMTGDYSIDFPAAAPGANNKILESDSLGVLSWIDTPSGGTITVQDDTSPSYNKIDTLNFIGGGVSIGNTTPNIADITVTRRNNGFSPFPIYQGDFQINVSPLKSKVIGVQTICDVQAGQLTVARIFGNIPDSCRINVAVYEGELYTAGSQATDTTKLRTFGSALQGPNPTPLTGIYRINLTTTPVWNPEAGTPIVVVIEIDNTTGAQGLAASILGQAVTTSVGNFANNLSFQVDGSTSLYNHLSPPVSGDGISKTIEIIGLDPAQERICHHFDPFAP